MCDEKKNVNKDVCMNHIESFYLQMQDPIKFVEDIFEKLETAAKENSFSKPQMIIEICKAKWDIRLMTTVLDNYRKEMRDQNV